MKVSLTHSGSLKRIIQHINLQIALHLTLRGSDHFRSFACFVAVYLLGVFSTHMALDGFC